MAVADVVDAGLGLLGFGSQERTNRINQREAEKNRRFQRGEASVNRAFQERMRNTEWQAAVADMHAAGINPAVAYSRGGASAPGGSMAGGSQAAPAGDSGASALSAMAQRKTLQIMEETRRKTAGEADAAQATGRLAGARAGYLLNSFKLHGKGGWTPPLLHELLDAELSTARAGATNMAAMAARNAQLVRTGRPGAELADRLGIALPILSGLSNPGSFGRALMRGRR